jgi:hypothetical protein
MNLDILRESDREDWLPLRRGYLTFYKADLPETTTALTFSRLIDPAESAMGAFIARENSEDGVALGITHWMDHRSCWTPGDLLPARPVCRADRAADRRGDGADRGRGGGGQETLLFASVLDHPRDQSRCSEDVCAGGGEERVHSVCEEIGVTAAFHFGEAGRVMSGRARSSRPRRRLLRPLALRRRVDGQDPRRRSSTTARSSPVRRADSAAARRNFTFRL